MPVTITFDVTKDPDIATEVQAPTDATIEIFNNYYNDGKITLGESLETANPNITNDTIIFNDSNSLTNYLTDIGPEPLNLGYTISNKVGF